MVLARVEHKFVLGSELSERPVEVHRLADRDVGVVFAVQNQDRRLGARMARLCRLDLALRDEAPA